MWKQLRGMRVLAACLTSVVVASGGCGGSEPRPKTSVSVSPKSEGPQCRQWGFARSSGTRGDDREPDQGPSPPPTPAPAPGDPGDECEPDQCGLNGMWFGQGLQFRELHLQPGIPNDQGLVLVGIVPPGVNHILELGIERDEFLARDSNGQIFKRGLELKGARILIESTTKTRQLAPGTPTLFTPPNKIDGSSGIQVGGWIEIQATAAE